jgi:glycosyltransferase involved in cell wall biosynthesis
MTEFSQERISRPTQWKEQGNFVYQAMLGDCHRLRMEAKLDSPAVSLLFCTRNRAGQLKTCLEHISRLHSLRTWELVVVDNGSTDETGRILSEYAAMVPFPTAILYEGRAGKSRGLNQGLRVARGEIIALIDDDCYVAPDHIDRVLDVFADPRIGFAGGRVELFDPTDFPMTIKTSTERELLPPRSYVEGGWVHGANMMFRRHVLEAIGGFDVDFGPGTPFIAEDPDALARASFAGWWGLYTPEVVVAHHHGRKAKDINALWRGYSMGIGAYIAKFVLIPETRAIYLRAWSRNWYWVFRKVLSGRYTLRSYLPYLWWEARGFWWQAQGFASYLIRRLRRLFTRWADGSRVSAGHVCSEKPNLRDSNGH